MFFSKLFKIIYSKNALSFFTVMLSCFVLSSCDLAKNQLKHDREKNLEFQDYRDAMAPRLPEVDVNATTDTNNIPPLQPYVAMPDSNTRAMPLVSININQNVPIQNALYQLAQQAEFDVEIDPRIVGSVIFSARNKPFDQVMERLSELAGLRYKMEDDFIRVELDVPFHKIYPVQYLNVVRDNTSSISNDISVVSGEGSDTGSNFSATNTSRSDFWLELETNLEQILLLGDINIGALTTEETPTVTSVSSSPTTIEPILLDESDLEGGPSVQVQAPEVNLEVGAVDGEAEEPEQLTDGPQPFAARFSINRQAGIVSVFAPERLHKKVESYLDEIMTRVNAQVLIEAKVLEVTLSDEYSAGIDWSHTGDILGSPLGIGFGLSTGQLIDPLTGLATGAVGDSLVRGILAPATNPTINGRLSFAGNGTSAFVDALSRFGTVSALSSPRLTVMNNQSSVLNVAENVVYFEVTAETTTTDGGGSVTTFETNANTVPVGVLINVLPSIDLDNGTITMAVRPTVTSLVGNGTQDPNPALIAVPSIIPTVNIQEFDSILTLNNGQAIVMGGLMQDRVISEQLGVPVVSEIPIIGNLFKNQNDQVTKTELVVVLKATIVEQGNTIHATDKDLYRTFSRDRRPFKL